MKQVDIFFDSIFYRMTKAYMKWDGKDGSTSWVGFSMIVFFVAIFIVLSLLILFAGRDTLKVYSDILKFVGVGFFVIVLIYFRRRYKGKYDDFHERWKDEPKFKKRLNGVLVILSLLIPVLLLISLSFLPDRITR